MNPIITYIEQRINTIKVRYRNSGLPEHARYDDDAILELKLVLDKIKELGPL